MIATMWSIVGVVALFVIFATAIMVGYCSSKPWPERVERFRK